MDHPVIRAKFERPAALFAALRAANCTHVSFAGGMKRPHLRVTKFDWKFLKIAPTLLPALKGGDDQSLRVITQIFESEGFEIIPPNQIVGGLVPETGVLTRAHPSEADRVDVARGREILRALAPVDVAQGTVVAQGICLGVESIQGTDTMLGFVADTGAAFRPDPKGAKGVLLKLPKLGQDRRIDLPAIGPQTIALAAAAGLAGVAVEQGGAMILGLDETVAEADRLGLFLWVTEPQE